jgi:hypothetical protein
MKRFGRSLALLIVVTGSVVRADADRNDEQDARDAVAKFIVALGTGDGATLKSIAFNGDGEMLQALADWTGAGRAYDAAARSRYGIIQPLMPESDKSPETIAQAVSGIRVYVSGDKARTDPMGMSHRTMQLQRVNGRWRVLVDSVLPVQTPQQNYASTLRLRIVAPIIRQMSTELGKYPDQNSAKTELLKRMKAALAASAEFQAASRAAQPAGAAPRPSAPEAPAEAPANPPNAGAPPQKPDMKKQRNDHRQEIPEGTVRSEMMGGNGGMPFVHVEDDHTPVLGFHYAIGQWNRAVIRQLDPIFEDTKTSAEEGTKTILARDGFVVGGLVVDTDGTNTVAVRVIFMKLKDGRPDPASKYISEWIGIPSRATVKTLAGKGETVIGTFGRKGMNLDAVGLVLAGSERK